MSKLIVSGCSWTDDFWTQGQGFPVWSELLAKKLGMECINLGACGGGNEYILSSLMEMMFEKDIGLMIAMWSEFPRMDFQIFSGFEPWSFHNYRKGWATVNMIGTNTPTAKWRDEIKDIFQNENVGTLPAMTYKGVKIFYTFQTMMEIHNIPYLQIQGCSPCTFESKPVLMKHLLRGNLVDKMNENTFIGWPIMAELGGTSMDQVLDEIDSDRKKLRISERDSHPNEEGHEVMCDFLYKKIKEEHGNL